MIEITITTKAGKFSMMGPEFVERFGEHLERGADTKTKELTESILLQLNAFLSTYEEEVKICECNENDGGCNNPDCKCHEEEVKTEEV